MQIFAVLGLAGLVVLATGCETIDDTGRDEAGKPSATPIVTLEKEEDDKSAELPVLVPREKWKCGGLELVAYGFSGAVTVGGHTERTAFKIEGIERRWDWCLTTEGSYDCTVTISPDGWGRYFNFRGTGGTVKPSDFFQCRKQ